MTFDCVDYDCVELYGTDMIVAISLFISYIMVS